MLNNVERAAGRCLQHRKIGSPWRLMSGSCVMVIASLAMAPASSGSPADSDQTATAAAIPSPKLALWGEYAMLAGTRWQDGDAILSYDWVVPGEELLMRIMTVSGEIENRTRLSAAGDSIVIQLGGRPGEPGQLLFPRTGIVIQQFPSRTTRTVMRFRGETIAVSEEENKNGIWAETSTSIRRRLSPTAMEEAVQALAAKRQGIKQRWGDLAAIAGKDWLSEDGVYHQVRWEGDDYSKIKWTRFNDTGLMSRQYYTVGAADKDGLVGLGVTGDFALEISPSGELLRNRTMRYQPLPDGIVDVSAGRYDKATRQFVVKTRYSVMRPSSPDIWKARNAAAKSAVAAAPPPAPKKNGGGLFGTLIGATVGAVAAGAIGANTSDAIGLITKGAAATSSDGATAAMLNGTSDIMTGGSAATGTSMAGLSGGSGGSYPTKPNLATASCPGFDESNYRSRALNEGGGDTQLFTMCGQAFEYYTMYKRAIAQGYSETDANRTYAAHEQAALNAQNFARNWSAK